MLTLWRSGGSHDNLHLPPLVPGFADQLYRSRLRSKTWSRTDPASTSGTHSIL